MRERFDWNLNENFIKPSLFVDRLCDELKLPDCNRINMRNSILDQVIVLIREKKGKNSLIKSFLNSDNSTCRKKHIFLSSKDWKRR